MLGIPTEGLEPELTKKMSNELNEKKNLLWSLLFVDATRTNLCTLASGSLNFFFNQM